MIANRWWSNRHPELASACDFHSALFQKVDRVMMVVRARLVSFVRLQMEMGDRQTEIE